MKRSPIVNIPRVIAFDGPGYPDESKWGHVKNGTLHFDEGTGFTYRAVRAGNADPVYWKPVLKDELTPIERDALKRKGYEVEG